jgi:glycosyltransferase involved in cell wall biosynthesis
MATKPVIVNGACAAFNDLTTHKKNALVVSKDYTLLTALNTLIEDEETCSRLGSAGKSKLKEYDWETVGSAFVQHCSTLMSSYELT